MDFVCSSFHCVCSNMLRHTLIHSILLGYVFGLRPGFCHSFFCSLHHGMLDLAFLLLYRSSTATVACGSIACACIACTCISCTRGSTLIIDFVVHIFNLLPTACQFFLDLYDRLLVPM